MSKKQALGRGLGALLPGTPIQPTKAKTDTPPVIGSMAGNICSLTISQIDNNPEQPRHEFDETALQELAQSIRELGIIQPITVHRVRADKYQIISGERRFRAAQLAGLESVPAYIREVNDQTLLEMALVENIQREDLHAIEVAISFQRLIEECNLTHEDLGQRLGKNRSTITNYVRLLQLPADMQLAVRHKTISMGHARALIAIDDPKWQQRVFERIQDEGLSVRAVEELARVKRQPQKPAHSTNKLLLTFDEQQVQADLKLKFGKSSRLKRTPSGGGKIELTYGDASELEELLKKLGI
jgi:ParB family transcriptional regulator, chromosome partitioning protein